MRHLWNWLISRISPREIDMSIRFYEDYFVEGKMGSMQLNPQASYESYKNSGGADPEILRVWKGRVDQSKISVDVLNEAKRCLSKAEYPTLLLDLWWDHCFEDIRFKLWRRRKIQNAELDFFLYWLVEPFLDRALKLPYDGKHELPERIPDILYMHRSINGYPIIKSVDLVEFSQQIGATLPKSKIGMFRKKSVHEISPLPSDPQFYGDPDKICAIKYEARDAHIPTGGIIRDVTDHYAKMGWKPLDYDLCFPYQQGCIHNGWLWGKYWSQFWIDDFRNVVFVTMMIGGCQMGEVKVLSMYSPNTYVREALEYYEQVHPISKGIVGDLSTPDYEHFHVFPIPPRDYGMSEELLSFKRRLFPAREQM